MSAISAIKEFLGIAHTPNHVFWTIGFLLVAVIALFILTYWYDRRHSIKFIKKGERNGY